MAEEFAGVPKGVTVTFDGVGVSSVAEMRRGDLHIWGTFVATIEIQRQIADEWVAMASYTAPTTAGDLTVFENAKTQPVRLECTEFTSGQVECAIE